MNRSKLWVWLSLATGTDNGNWAKLRRHFSDAEQVYRAGAQELSFLGETALFDRLLDKRLDRAEEILDVCSLKGYQILPCTSSLFPAALREISHSPCLLYAAGDLSLLCRPAVAVVGTRAATSYAAMKTYSMAHSWAEAGITVVSGMAAGIDAVAHVAALDADGATVAVLAGGLDVVFPASHTELHEAIRERGLILSECPPGTPCARFRFPARNRIVSALSDAVCVMEGKLKSGSLITARHALEQGKQVMAMVGITGREGAEGPLQLLEMGAMPLADAADLPLATERPILSFREEMTDSELADMLACYGVQLEKPKAATRRPSRRHAAVPAKRPAAPSVDLSGLSETEQRICSALEAAGPCSADELVGNGLTISAVLTALTKLELLGVILRHPDGSYGLPTH